MTALLGIKIGMTRVFDSEGRSIPVTAIQAGPCVVTQVKNKERDSYDAIQIGFGIAKHPTKPEAGHTKALGHAPQFLREFPVDDITAFTVGQQLDCSVFEIGGKLNLVGISKGKGFSGVIKRHNFSRGPETHGSDHHRAPGSIGAMFPQHVMKGKKMPGKHGNDQITLHKVKVVDVDPTQNLVFVKGPVPGSRGALVEISVI